MGVKLPSVRRSDSLYAQLGGKASIEAAVEKFYEKVLADRELKPFFAKTNMTWLKLRQTQFMSQALGGPADYKGRSMKSAHAKLLIEPRHFERVGTHLAVTLTELGVPPELVDTVMEKIGGLEGDIVTVRKNDSGDTEQGLTMAQVRAMLENSPINIMLADLDMNIIYVNPASEKLLGTLEKFLPVTADKVVGSSIDIFHKNAAYQRKILSNPRNLPHRSNIQIGDQTADLLATAIYDEKNNYIGPMVTWSLITDRLKTETEMSRVMSMMENAPINIMSADLDLKLQYLNPAAKNLMRKIEQYLPVRADQMIGTAIDIFHKNPEQQRKFLSNDRNLPFSAQIEIGPESFDLKVSAIYDQNKKYLGPMVTWEQITEKLAAERTIKEAQERERKQVEELKTTMATVAQNASGLATASEELTAVSQQMSTNAEETASQANVVSAASEQVNRSLQTVATGTEEMSSSIKEIAKNAADAAKVASEAVKVAQSTNTTVAKLGESSAEISQVIKLITSIAQQTNLLALNATIEAARAGEAGKGFAVVANEVKELAKETAKATEDISRKIEAIQSDTKGAVEAIGAIGAIITQVNDFSNTIATAVEEQNATTTEMTRNVNEAAKGAGEIAKNIAGVAEAAKSTSRGAGDSQKAAQSLASMSAELRGLVGRYKF
ncbi:MAG: PAS domain S-box protein [Acidobacteriia bacterium]|nr:PAS domain S-box protein [Terriglobia bacterium]